MSTLRAKTKARFTRVLENCYFSAANFAVAYPEGGDVELVVEFIPRPEFTFTLMRYEPVGYRTLECPSDHFLVEDSYEWDELEECLVALHQWTERIEEEYRTGHPVLDEFEAFRESMEAKFRSHVEDEHAHFTSEQAASLRVRLDDLAAELSRLSERTTEGERRLTQANEEIAALKADLDRLPRGIWFRKASAKTLGILKAVVASKEAREFALEAAKKLLLGGPK